MTHPRPATIFPIGHKLLWFVLAVCLPALFLLGWPGVSLQETDLLMHVKVSRPPEGLSVASLSVSNISVRVRGTPTALKRLLASKLRPYVASLLKLDAGVHSVPIDRTRLPLPREITTVSIKPALFIVKLEKEIQKQVPVVVTMSGKPKAGFLVSDAFAQPAYVRLRGPQSHFQALQKISTRPVNVKGRAKSFKREIPLSLPRGLEPVESTGVVVAQIVIREKIVIRTFTHVTVKGCNSDWSYTIRPGTLAVQLKGAQNLLEGLFASAGPTVYVNLHGLQPGVYVRRAVIALPLGMTLLHATPELFTVTLQKKHLRRGKK